MLKLGDIEVDGSSGAIGLTNEKLTVMLVDDHALFRAGLVVLLAKMPEIGDIIEAENGVSAEQALASDLDLDLIILDYELPDTNGLSLLGDIKSRMPEVPVILLSANVDAKLIQSALAQHASGFITKTSSPDVMLSAMQLVLSGGIYIPPEAISALKAMPESAVMEEESIKPTRSTSDSTQLTQRQTDVLMQMKLGLSNKEIARKLNMSPSTVKVHVAAILRALDVSSRTQAVFMAKDQGLLD